VEDWLFQESLQHLIGKEAELIIENIKELPFFNKGKI
jgi:hypothetical protein